MWIAFQRHTDWKLGPLFADLLVTMLQPLFTKLFVNIVAAAAAAARGYGAMAARLTPDQKVGSSNLSALTFAVWCCAFYEIERSFARNPDVQTQ